MKITKYEHACLDISTRDGRIVIDPGEFSKSFQASAGIQALIITHVHGDHLSTETVKSIVEANPNVQIFSTSEVAAKLAEQKVTIPELNKIYSVSNITLEFFGEKHAVIDPETPVVENFGVLVNNELYYPGDSFTECPKPFTVLAIPSSAPWLRVGETLPLIENSQCKYVFPTHNVMLSEPGNNFTNHWLQQFSERNNKEFVVLKPGESIDT